MIQVLSNLATLDIHRALHRAFPGEGFHVHTVALHQHEVTPDNTARTEAEIKEALDGWKAGGALAHAKAGALARIEAATSAALMGFRITSGGDDAVITSGWAAHVRIVMRRNEELRAAVGKVKSRTALDGLDLSF